MDANARLLDAHLSGYEAWDYYVDWCEARDLGPDSAEAEEAFGAWMERD
jgi:hypothetical protein